MPEDNFPAPFYRTPGDAKRSLASATTFTRTILFYWKVLMITLKAQRLASRGRYDDLEWARSSRRIVSDAELCGADVEIKGLDNISAHGGPAVFIGNHMSVFETYALAAMLIPGKKPAFIIKRELLEYPLFGKVMSSVPHIAVGRKNPKDDFKDVMEQGCELMSKGISPIVFPQATRMREFVPEKFNTIGVKLARKAAVPVIPFALKTDFWGNGKMIKDLGPIGRSSRKIFFEFAPAMTVSGSGKDEHERIISFIKAKLAEWEDPSHVNIH